MKKFDVKRLIGTIVGVVLVVAVLAIVDGNAEKKLLGTWAYTYDVEYEEGVDVELTEFLEFTEGEYRWYMDRETTKTALLKTYDEYFEEYEVTEEDVIAAGYKSFEDCKTQWLEEDLEYIVDDYNEEEGGKGTWQINRGEFTFIEEGTSAEFITDYKIEDGKLYLQTDGLVLTKVK
ncbi:MAG: hypothetical protein IJA43_04675 [Clostridia bacterium]|nr:hypothetical protein [Oscillospiraceae bacterium]MBQ3523733.1 hypothetical protein [Clostridia bacterium]